MFFCQHALVLVSECHFLQVAQMSESVFQLFLKLIDGSLSSLLVSKQNQSFTKALLEFLTAHESLKVCLVHLLLEKLVEVLNLLLNLSCVAALLDWHNFLSLLRRRASLLCCRIFQLSFDGSDFLYQLLEVPLPKISQSVRKLVSSLA